MQNFTIYAFMLSTIALVFYTTGVWAEQHAKRLKPWHAAVFFVGISADIVGTGLMIELVGGIRITTHSVLGILGLQLMIIHFVWAVTTLVRSVAFYGNVERTITGFHNYSLVIWGFWMTAYITGVYMGIKSMNF